MKIDQRRIEALAKQLGKGRADRVDPEATARVLVARLGQQRERQTRWWQEFRALKAAAAVILVVGSGLILNELRRPPGAEVNIGTPFVLESLGDGELEQVLDSLDYEAPVSEFVVGELTDLSESELQELLAIMEG